MADLEVRDDLHSHNETVLKNLEKGDLVEIKRKSTWKIPAYSHWAVYIGDAMVIHLTVDENDGSSAYVESVSTVCCYNKSTGIVKVDGFWDATCGSKAFKNNDKDGNMRPLEAEEIVERAKFMIGLKGYNALWDNCEHFVSCCRYGLSKSDQADTVKFLLEIVGDKSARGAVRKIIAHAEKVFVIGKYAVGGVASLAVLAAVLEIVTHADKILMGEKLSVVGIEVLVAVLQVVAANIFVGTTLVVVVIALATAREFFTHADNVSWKKKLAVVGLDGLAAVLPITALQKFVGNKLAVGGVTGLAIVREMFTNISWKEKLAVVGIDGLAAELQAVAGKSFVGKVAVVAIPALIAVVCKAITFEKSSWKMREI